jgi:hypothetical protein
MPKKLQSKAARDRSYHVMMAALAEEMRVCKLSREERSRRSREIWQDCYGDMKEGKRDDGTVDQDAPADRDRAAG